MLLSELFGEILGTFTPLCRVRDSVSQKYFGPGTMIDHEERFHGRDHLVRIRQSDCCCTIMNVHFQPEGFLKELCRRQNFAATSCQPTPTVWVLSWVTSISVTLMKEDSTHGTRPSVTRTPAEPPPSSPPSPAQWKLLSPRFTRTKSEMALSTHCLELTVSS